MDRKQSAVADFLSPTTQEPSLLVGVVSPLRCSDWDHLISKHPDSSFFHTAAWAHVLLESYGYRPIYYTAIQDSRLMALLPVMEVDSWLTGRRGVSLPFTDACEPLGSPSLLMRTIIPWVLQTGEERGWKCFECRGGEGLFKTDMAAQRFYSHDLRLLRDEDLLFNRLSSSVRTAIRKAQKSGVIVEVNQNLDAMLRFYRLHCLTRKKHGLPPQPFKFFKQIHECIISQGKGAVILARLGEHLVAASIYFSFNALAFYKYGASNPAFQSLRGNNLVMWHGIKWGISQGAEVLNLGRTSIHNEGLRRYKLGWGAEERIASYYKFDIRGHTFVRDRDKTSGWHVPIFRRLPIFLARQFGSALYRHIG
jgi:hypothetical protein